MNKELEKLLENKKPSSLTDLNEVPGSLINEARKLASPRAREMFFSYLVVPTDQHYIRRFIIDCVENNTSPQQWLRGRILTPSPGLEDQLTKTRADILSGSNDHFTHYLPANYEGWKQGSSFGGSPVLDDPESTYRSPMPLGMASISAKYIIPRSEVNNIAMHRRWIAQRIARCINMHKDTLAQEQIIKKTSEFVPENKWIDDVHYAIKGLSAELDQGLIKEGLVPGFILPDDFYL
jgi:hypothetical protein